MSEMVARPAPAGEVHRVVFRADLAADAAQIWALIGAFDSLPRWHPLVVECTLEREAESGAMVRRIRLHDGTVIRNRLLEHDDRSRRYSYEFVEGPLKVKSYRATLQVTERGGGRATLDWVSEFKAGEETADEARARVESLVSPGIANLKRIFGG